MVVGHEAYLKRDPTLAEHAVGELQGRWLVNPTSKRFALEATTSVLKYMTPLTFFVHLTIHLFYKFCLQIDKPIS
jgi:hypothetical protein